jgi:hypothetical protein
MSVTINIGLCVVFSVIYSLRPVNYRKTIAQSFLPLMQNCQVARILSSLMPSNSKFLITNGKSIWPHMIIQALVKRRSYHGGMNNVVINLHLFISIARVVLCSQMEAGTGSYLPENTRLEKHLCPIILASTVYYPVGNFRGCLAVPRLSLYQATKLNNL